MLKEEKFCRGLKYATKPLERITGEVEDDKKFQNLI